jgi:hypothetical protein
MNKKTKNNLLVKLICFTATLFCLSNLSLAQESVANDSLKWKLKLMGSGSVLDGNASRVVLFNKFNANYFGKHVNLITEQVYTYGVSFHQKTENDLRSENFIDVRPSKKIVPFVRLFFETNYLRQINFRYQPGIGSAYFFVKNKLHSFRFFVAIAYESTEYRTSYFVHRTDTVTNSISYLGAILGAVGNHQILNGKVGIDYRLYYQQGFENSLEYRTYGELGISYRLNRHFAIQTNARYSYENIIPLGFKPYDFIWTYGFAISNF